MQCAHFYVLHLASLERTVIDRYSTLALTNDIHEVCFSVALSHNLCIGIPEIHLSITAQLVNNRCVVILNWNHVD